jgi:dTDP-4-dehydrorhamnose reductase
MKILIIGSSGALGRELFNYLKIKKMNVYNNGLIKRKLNLTLYKNSLSILKKIKPEIIINCTGVTNIDQCEKDKKLAISVHKNLLNNIFKAEKKLKLKTFTIHFSTDHIYDNKDGRLNNEKQKPVLYNFYSKSKIISENICLKKNSLILRTNFFGNFLTNKKSFDQWIMSIVKKKKTLNLANDVFFSPLSISSISHIIYQILNKKKFLKGVFNLGSKNGMSKFLFAKNFLKFNNIKVFKYKKCKIKDLTEAKRPKNMMLDVSKFEKNFNIKLPTLISEIKKEVRNNYV